MLVSSDQKSGAAGDFDHKLFSSQDFFTAIVPLRDGVIVAVKRYCIHGLASYCAQAPLN